MAGSAPAYAAKLGPAGSVKAPTSVPPARRNARLQLRGEVQDGASPDALGDQL